MFLTSEDDITALVGLTVVSTITLVPLGMIRKSYCFTIGYAAAVTAMALTMLSCFGFDKGVSSWLAVLLVLYGARLVAFLLYRDLTVRNMTTSTKLFDEKICRLQALCISTFLSIFYACMVSPVLFSLRHEQPLTFSSYAIHHTGAFLTLLGLVLETVADHQKLMCKKRQKVSYADKRFASPTEGFVYSLCRHPNYMGDTMFWTGIYSGGKAGSTTTSSVGYISGTIGWIGIVLILFGAAQRLDKIQKTRYGGQKEYERWCQKVQYSLIPYLH